MRRITQFLLNGVWAVLIFIYITGGLGLISNGYIFIGLSFYLGPVIIIALLACVKYQGEKNGNKHTSNNH